VPQVGLDHALDALVFQATGHFLVLNMGEMLDIAHSAEFGNEVQRMGKKKDGMIMKS
jgi:hypothetical protein